MHKKIKELLESIQSDTSADDLASVHKSLNEIKQLLIIQLLKTELEDIHYLMGGDKPKADPKAETEKPQADDLKEPNSVDLKVDGDGEKPIKADNGEGGLLTKDVLDKHWNKFLENLGDVATTKIENEVKMYLLHRPTENFEYSDGKDKNEYTTEGETTWFAEFMSSEINMEGQNPVVSCWVPEDCLTGTSKPHDNTGAWGDLGKNPFAEVMNVSVKAGTYKIYQELNQRR